MERKIIISSFASTVTSLAGKPVVRSDSTRLPPNGLDLERQPRSFYLAEWTFPLVVNYKTPDQSEQVLKKSNKKRERFTVAPLCGLKTNERQSEKCHCTASISNEFIFFTVSCTPIRQLTHRVTLQSSSVQESGRRICLQKFNFILDGNLVLLPQSEIYL